MVFFYSSLLGTSITFLLRNRKTSRVASSCGWYPPHSKTFYFHVSDTNRYFFLPSVLYECCAAKDSRLRIMSVARHSNSKTRGVNPTSQSVLTDLSYCWHGFGLRWPVSGWRASQFAYHWDHFSEISGFLMIYSYAYNTHNSGMWEAWDSNLRPRDDRGRNQWVITVCILIMH